MRNFNPFAVRPLPRLYAPADGAAGGGADDAGDAGDTGNGADDDAAGDDADGEADGDEGQDRSQADDDDDALVFGTDQDDEDDRPLEERHKRLSTAHNKLKRRFGKNLPTLKALKAAGITDANDAIQKVRSFDALLERADGDVNKLLRLLQQQEPGGTRDTGRDDRMTKAEAKELADEFDLSDDEFQKLWQTDTDAGKFFMKLSRSHSSTSKLLKAAMARLDQLEGGIKQKDTQAVQNTWLGVIKAGAAKIKDEDTRDVYSDLMKAAYRESTAMGRRFNPEEVSTKILRKLKVNPQTARIVQGAQQQRMANNNANRPKHQAGGHGSTAAPAKGKKESLIDVHRRLRSVG